MEGGMGEDAPGSCGYPQMDDPSLSAKRAKLDASEDRLLNFATAADEFELSLKRQKIPRDPMSHRIIEKRRRDRMNNCLADLSRLIPASYHKQGQGRIEKTEIIEMAIRHINLLQQRVDELEKKVNNPEESKVQTTATLVTPKIITPDCSSSKFYMGFKDAQDEVMRFLVEVESINTMDPFCKKIMKHLENASQKFVVKEQKTELSPMDSESGSQPPMFSHHHSAFYPTQGRGSGGEGGGGGGERGTGGVGEPSLPDDGVLGGGDMDTKSQDDRLRYLLGEQPGSMVGRVMTDSGPPDTTEDRRGSLPMFSYSSHLSGTGSVVGSSGYISDTSNMDKNSPSGSTSSRDNVYKFKHNITKRFSQEGRHHRYSHHHHHISAHHHHRNHQHTTSDSSSNTSSRDLEDDQGQLRWKRGGGGGNGGGGGKHHHKSSGSSSLFTDDLIGAENNSPNSDECNSGSNSGNSSSTTATSARSHHHHRGYNNNNNNSNNSNGGEDKSGQMGSCGSIECHNNASSLSLSSSSAAACQSSSMSSVALPGFILHPTGTHYMPISVHNSNMSGLFESSGDQESMPVFHPISIPVHFRRPVISMPNITICTHLSSKQKDRNIKE